MAAQSTFEFTSVVGVCVCVCGGGGGGVGGYDVIFNITAVGLQLFFWFGGGVLSKFLLDNSSFSAPPPPPLLIVIAQSLNEMGIEIRKTKKNIEDTEDLYLA